MQHSISCPSCSRPVPVEGVDRLPPWCKGCGAALSRSLLPTAVAVGRGEPTRPAAAPIARAPAPVALAPSPSAYFTAVVPTVMQHERLNAYRCYVAGGSLLAFPAGFGSIRDGQYVPQNHITRIIGGIGHGAKITNPTRIDCELRGLRAAEGLETIDDSSEDAILCAAESTFGVVALPAENLRHTRIEGVGFWFTLLRGFRCAAVLKLEAGNVRTLALPSLTDARRAVESLRSLVGGSLHVDLPWGSRRT